MSTMIVFLTSLGKTGRKGRAYVRNGRRPKPKADEGSKEG
jgi:hypothetical protein